MVEVISTCPISYGRYNKMPDPAEMMKYIKNNTVSVRTVKEMMAEQGEDFNPADLKDKYIVGRHFVDDSVPEYCDEMDAMIARVKGGAE